MVNIMVKPSSSFAHDDIVADSCIIVRLKLINLNICNSNNHNKKTHSSTFSGQLSNGDKDRLNGLFCKAFKCGLCSYAFRIDDLICDADTKLFRQASDQTHCLHQLLPQQRPKKFLSSLRSRRHSYTLPHI